VWAGIVPYGAAALMVLAATAATYATRDVIGSSISILFFPAVLFSAIYGGYGPALLATVLSTATLAYIVIRPHTSFEIGADDLIRLGIFAVVAMVTASISSARKRAEDAQRQALDELQGALEILQQVAVREERLRLARDLHDGVLQSFTGIRLRIEALAGHPDAPPSARETLRAVERAIAIEQRELRSFIENLKPLSSGPGRRAR
jgi:signal transduction histidine kinase